MAQGVANFRRSPGRFRCCRLRWGFVQVSLQGVQHGCSWVCTAFSSCAAAAGERPGGGWRRIGKCILLAEQFRFHIPFLGKIAS
jgi:hypothetical protein